MSCFPLEPCGMLVCPCYMRKILPGVSLIPHLGVSKAPNTLSSQEIKQATSRVWRPSHSIINFLLWHWYLIRVWVPVLGAPHPSRLSTAGLMDSSPFLTPTREICCQFRSYGQRREPVDGISASLVLCLLNTYK